MRKLIELFKCFSVLLLCSMVAPASAQTKLINPHLPNNFIYSYLLPDSTLRFIGSEHGTDRELFFIDKYTNGTIAKPVFFPERLGDVDFNFAGVDCKVLPLKSGDVILGINQADCDYVPYSSLARFDVDGEVLWAVSMESFSFDYQVHKLTMVDSAIIGLISDELDTLYFDIDGNQMTGSLSYTVYDTVIPAKIGYYASLGQNLYHLDERFEVFDFVSLDDDIRTVSAAGDSLIIVSTASSLGILDTNLEINVYSDDFANFDLVTNSVDWVWIGQKDGDILQLDLLLQPHDTFIMPENIQLKSMVVLNENLTLGGHYISVTGSSVFFHTTDVNQFNFDIKKDITLEAMNIKQPLYYNFEPFAEPWGFNIVYHDVVITVSNAGQDTVQSLTILYSVGSGCYFCNGESHRWAFDSLNLYPGLQVDFELNDFSVWCITQSPTKFCLSILPADSLPETDQLNNKLCIDVDALITGLEEAESNIWSISPNPANEFINIRIDDGNNRMEQGVIINGRGQLVERIDLTENNTRIDLTDYVTGMYFLQIMNAQGGFFSKKFSVIH